jgi:Mn-dependent DtxR family transcriptional regulator/Fe2+ transport system protein FeoA
MSRNNIANYLKAAYVVQQTHRLVGPGDLAERLGVSVSTASVMLQRMASKGLVERVGRGSMRLTEKGREEAERVVRKHRLAETFLYRVLGYPLEALHEEAMQLEAAMSDRLERAIDSLLDFPEKDPHGHPIPRPSMGTQPEHKDHDSRGISEGGPAAAHTKGSREKASSVSSADLRAKKRKENRTRALSSRSSGRARFEDPSDSNQKESSWQVTLDEAPAGALAHVESLDDQDSGALRRVAELGLLPGRRFKVAEKDEYGEIIWLETVAGRKQRIAVGFGLARRVTVGLLRRR